MRIEKVRIHNLNALYGIHEIDFTDHAYKENNLFLLCGDMGSGKTTVLDAITLALYGRTSRLKSISKENNEIMSKGTYECSAEVTFSVDGKAYRASWFQDYTNKNKPKAQHKLNQPKREITTIETQELVSGIKPCETKIQSLIKLDYDQFTKAVLLEQGKFAEFLNSDLGKRAEILEKITNTEIYTKLSIAAHKRCAEEQKKFEDAERDLQGIKILTPSELEELRAKQASITTSVLQLDQQIAQATQEIQWHTDVSEAKSKWAQMDVEMTDHQTQLKAFEPERQKIEPAKRADEIAHIYENLSFMRETCQRIEREVHEIQNQVPDVEQAKTTLETVVISCQNQLDTIRQEKENQNPIFNQVRRLQTEYGALQRECTETNNRISEISKKICDLEAQHQDAQAKNDECCARLAKAAVFFEENAVDERLISEFEAIKGRYEQMQRAANDVVMAKDALTQSIQNLNQATKTQEKVKHQVEAMEHQYHVACIDAQNALHTFETLRDGHAIEDLEYILECLRKEKFNAEITATYAEALKKLADGQPCPLCGALEHPYSHGGAPQVSEIDEKINERTKQLQAIKKAENQFHKLEKQKQERESQLNSVKLAQAQIAAAQKSAQQAVQDKTEQCQKAETSQTARLIEFNQSIQKYQISASSHTEAQTCLSDLKNRLERWNKAIATRQSLENDQKLSKDDLTRIQTQLDASREQHRKENALCQAKMEQRDAKKSEILELFGNRNVDDEERKLNTALNQAETQLNQANQDLQKAQVTLSQLKTKYTERQNRLHEETQKYQNQALQWHSECSQRFENEEQFVAARLPKQDLVTLIKRAEDLERQTATLKTRQLEAQKTYEEKQAQNLTQRSLEEIQILKNQQESLKNQQLMERGAIQQKLDDHAKKSVEIEQLTQKLEKTRQEKQRWEALSALIGNSESAKNNKFRDFAQGITFQILLQNANNYLQNKKLMPRYALIQEQEGSLEFLVHDAHTGKIRHSANLSGGEKFCMSLALALGLSDMASENVVIDSLFIDEGLGTLDDQTLDDAINMLKTLGATETGRNQLIGLITHVTRAKETIDTRIHAEKLGNGKSRLNGPGCSRK